ncbi:MAG: DNA (cytosine-5-)-methyltransferase [Chthoniobacterales bacterium]
MKHTTSPGKFSFKFADIFAGIGGFRIALEGFGGHCIFSSEWDRFSQKTYSAWFGEIPTGDIREVNPSSIPDHDILTAGFPCQPFSLAGVSKKNSLGRAHGFRDATQGTLFFTLATLIEAKRPRILFLENVKNLLSHDKGNTWRVIRETLDALDYEVNAKVIDAAHWVPQHRERIFIIGFDRRVFGNFPAFSFPSISQQPKPRFASILEKNPSEKYTLSDRLWAYLQEYAERHRKKGNGFGFGFADLNGVSRTLSARYYKDGSEILIPQKGKNPRKLTPREAARLMGFPDEKPIVVSDTQAYRQFGNAVSPPAVKAIGKNIVAVLREHFSKSLSDGRPLKENT